MGCTRRAALAAVIGFVAATSYGQTYPVKPVRWIVPWPAGGGADNIVRMLAPKLGEGLGQQVIVDNRGGAAGNIGAELAAKSPADGYTILFAYAGTHSVNRNLYRSMPFQESDFAPIVWLSAVPQVLVVHPSLPVKNVRALVALAKHRPDQMSYASPGNGTINHLSAELFKLLSGARMVHVPYKGGAAAGIAVMAGEVALLFGDPGASLPHVKSGKLRALAVTSPKRAIAAPDLLTMMEAGVSGYDVTSWNGVLAPAATPPAIVKRLNAELNRTITAPDMRDRLLANGYEPVGGEPERFGELIARETLKWAKVVKAAGMQVD